MKKSLFILAGALCLSGAVMAQETDTTKVKTQSSQSTEATQNPQQNYKKDMVTIKSTEIPASLQTTLQGSEYKGWETGTIYRNQNSDMYLIEITDGTKTTPYRFDANGKVIKDNK